MAQEQNLLLVEMHITAEEYQRRLDLGDEETAYLINFTHDHNELISETHLPRIVEDAAGTAGLPKPEQWDIWETPTTERAEMLRTAAEHWHPANRCSTSFWHGDPEAARKLVEQATNQAASQNALEEAST